VGYVKKKGLGLLWGNVQKLDGTVTFFDTVPSRRNRSKDQSSSVWTEL